MLTPGFVLLDRARREAGRLLDVVGLGPAEAPFRIVASWQGARLRAYQERDRRPAPTLLILAAPIKRPYILDLLPEVSVVRHCLRHGFRVFLLEWLDPGAAEDEFGLAEYAYRLPLAALDAIAAETACRAVLLAGHSLGGTLAALFAALEPDRLRGLLLVGAPLAFGPGAGGRLAQAVSGMPPAALLRAAVGSPVPGSFLDLLAAMALPDEFLFRRWVDVGGPLSDPLAAAIHTRVERWSLDEFALPGRLFEEVVEMLYREDRFLAGSLDIAAGRRARATRLRGPVLTVVNERDPVVPPASTLVALEAAPDVSLRQMWHAPGRGTTLAHLAPLVAPEAHEALWPGILDWLENCWTS